MRRLIFGLLTDERSSLGERAKKPLVAFLRSDTPQSKECAEPSVPRRRQTTMRLGRAAIGHGYSMMNPINVLMSDEARPPKLVCWKSTSATKKDSIVDTISAMEFYFFAIKPQILMVLERFL